MKELSAKSRLKVWIREICKKYSINEDDLSSYRLAAIRVFTEVIIDYWEVENHYKLERKSNLIEYIFTKTNILYDSKIGIKKSFVIDVKVFASVFIKEHHHDLSNILAWLYQFFNFNEINDLHKNTQYFTDDYMVNKLVDDSLYGLKEDKILDMKIIDPACGGGNFIIRIIEFMVINYSFSKEEILNFVSQKIYGYDIDSKLVGVCYINIILKLLFLKLIDLDQISDFTIQLYYDQDNPYGSLLLDGNDHKVFNLSSGNVMRYDDIFSDKYDLVITNPPFMGKRDMVPELRKYLNKHYVLAKGDMCTSFLVRSEMLLKDNGIYSFVSQNNWMFLSSMHTFRKHFLSGNRIERIYDLGSYAFADINGEKTSVVLLHATKGFTGNDFQVIGLKNLYYKEKVNALRNDDFDDLKYNVHVSNLNDENQFRIDYLNTGKLRNILQSSRKYSEFGMPMQGTSTGNNKKYVCYQWETTDASWVLVSKGGGYSKWTGLNMYKVHWGINGEIIKEEPGSVIRNQKYIRDAELVYSDTGTYGLSVRLKRKDQIFIASGPGIKVIEGDVFNHLAFLNSYFSSYFIKTITPKLTISANYIGKLPVPEGILNSNKINHLSKKAVDLKKRFNIKRPIYYEFHHDEYFKYGDVRTFAKSDFKDDLYLEYNRLKCEHKINKLIMQAYGLTESETSIIKKTIGCQVFDMTGSKLEISITQLDKEIASILDNNCILTRKSVTRGNLGVEGIIEYCALKYECSPKVILDLMTNSVDQFKKVVEKYEMHTLHRAWLYLNKYKANEKTLNVVDYEISNIKMKHDKIVKWHNKAFKNKGLNFMENIDDI